MSTVDAAIIEYIVNNNSAGSSSTPTQDVYTKIEGLTTVLYQGSEVMYSLRIQGLKSSDLKTGNVIRIAYDDGTENTWFIIRNSFMKNDSNGNASFTIIDANTGIYIGTAYFQNNDDSYELKVYPESGKNFATPTEEHGLYRMDEMSLRTMQLLIANQYTTWFN